MCDTASVQNLDHCPVKPKYFTHFRVEESPFTTRNITEANGLVHIGTRVSFKTLVENFTNLAQQLPRQIALGKENTPLVQATTSQFSSVNVLGIAADDPTPYKDTLLNYLYHTQKPD